MKPVLLFSALALISLPAAAQQGRAEKIYSRVNDAVFQVLTYHSDNTLHGKASGVVIKSKGWLVTNFHVYGDATLLIAQHNGKFLDLDHIVRADAEKDILICSINLDSSAALLSQMPDLKIADEEALNVGETVYAIGSPFGYENTITDGLVSGLRSSPDSLRHFIQISAPVSSGSSGGAVINAKGELIGISTFIVAADDAQNINFAIPIHEVFDFIPGEQRMDIMEGEDAESEFFSRAIRYYQQELFLLALLDFQQFNLLAKYKNSRGLFYAGRCQEELNNLDSAQWYFTKSALLELYFAPAYLGLARVHLAKGNTEKALYFQERAFQIDPSLRNRKEKE